MSRKKDLPPAFLPLSFCLSITGSQGQGSRWCHAGCMPCIRLPVGTSNGFSLFLTRLHSRPSSAAVGRASCGRELVTRLVNHSSESERRDGLRILHSLLSFLSLGELLLSLASPSLPFARQHRTVGVSCRCHLVSSS